MYEVVFSANATFSPCAALTNASVIRPPLASILERRNWPAGFDWNARTSGSLRRTSFHFELSIPGSGPLAFCSATALTITGSAAQPRHVQDQRDAPVTQNRGSRDAGDLLKVGFEALDHDLLLAAELVDEQRDIASPVLDDDHDPLRGILGRGRDVEHAVQPDHGHRLSADHHDLRVGEDARYLPGPRPQRLDDRGEGQDVGVRPHAERLAVEDDQREGQPDIEGS